MVLLFLNYFFIMTPHWKILMLAFFSEYPLIISSNMCFAEPALSVSKFRNAQSFVRFLGAYIRNNMCV